ncbi:FadR family transcriptional regulator [Oxalobacteraceae bacterium]|nr:FadR family transcriptional regulator [Oxalobacteraceae bacterium]
MSTAQHTDHAAPPPRQPKRGEQIAAQIRQDILANTYAVGTLLGNEAELMRRYGIARATLREAIRQLERQGLAIMRRGIGGGLLVQQPARKAAAYALANYLELSHVSMDELFELREQFELQIISEAMQRPDSGEHARLLQLLAELEAAPLSDLANEGRRHLAIRNAVNALTHNPAAALLLETMHRVTVTALPQFHSIAEMSDYAAQARARKRRLITAIVAGELEQARQSVLEDLRYTRQVVARQLAAFDREAAGAATATLDVTPNVAGQAMHRKLAHRLAVTISREIALDQLAPGTRLGAEVDLLKKYAVSRAVFREAIRTLELHAIVQTRRGAKGGLVVGLPCPTYTIDLVAGYFHHIKLQRNHLYAVWCALMLAAAQWAASRASPAAIEQLRRLSAEAVGGGPASLVKAMTALQIAIAKHCGNRTLSLFSQLLIRFSMLYRSAEPDGAEQVMAAHRALVAAIAARDAALARQRMGETIAVIDQFWSISGRSLGETPGLPKLPA